MRAHASPGNQSINPSSQSQTSQQNRYKLSEIPVFGDKLVSKNNNTFRILFENADGLPASGNSNCTWKYKKLNRTIQQLGIDAICLAETQINWNLVDPKFNLSQHIDRTTPTIFSQACNSNEKFTARQQGGTAVIYKHSLSSLVVTTDKDPTNLGRWSSITLHKPGNRKIRFIAAYQAVKKSKDKGLNTVYAQQRRYFLQKGNSLCPNLNFKRDMELLLESCFQQGEKFLLCID